MAFSHQVWSLDTRKVAFLHYCRSRDRRFRAKKTCSGPRYDRSCTSHERKVHAWRFSKANQGYNPASRPGFSWYWGSMTIPIRFRGHRSLCEKCIRPTLHARGALAPSALCVEYSTRQPRKYQLTTPDAKGKQCQPTPHLP